jgi:hypothetical protein
MDKKKRFASLMEDHSHDPNDAAFRSLSPFGSDHRSGTGAGVGGRSFVASSHTGFDLGHDLDQDQQAVLSCVYVLSRCLLLWALGLGLTKCAGQKRRPKKTAHGTDSLYGQL